MPTENNNGTNTSDEQIPPAATEQNADAQAHVDPAKIVEHLDAENAERHERERAEEAAANERANEIAPYELVLPQYQAIAEAYREDAAAIAQDANIPAGEMEAMLHLAMGGALEAVAQDKAGALSTGQVPGVDLSNRNACMGYLVHKYGDQAPIIVREAQAAYAKLPRSVQAYLDHDSGTGELLTNSPHVLLALAARNLGWTGLSRESAEKELARLQGSKKLSAFDLDKRRILGHIVSRAKASASAPKTKAAPKVAPSVTAGIDKRIAEIRRDPNYGNRDANPVLHRALVNEMTQLYAAKHGGK